MDLLTYLPATLQRPTTTISRISAGLSGAGVYRVDAAGQTLVLKVTSADVPIADWSRTLHVLRLASEAGLAPRIIHADETRRAVLSEFVVDRSFAALYGDPRTHDAALALLGKTLRGVHNIPVSEDMTVADPRSVLVSTWSRLETDVAVPRFVGDAVARALADAPLLRGKVVLSHNDVNPSNLVHDGADLLLLDWDATAPNDPYYDLAAIAVFLRMDDETCRRLIAAHDEAPSDRLPPSFDYWRQLVAVLCGTTFLRLAHRSGHPGAPGGETLDSVPALGDLYQRLRAGTLTLATAEGLWDFGLALVKVGAERGIRD